MSFTAAFESDCERCDVTIKEGDEAVMVGTGLVAHKTCPAPIRVVPVCSGCNLAHAGECW